MRSLIVYDSQFGNTEQIARAMGAALGGETTVARPADVRASELPSIGLLIVGSPTQGGRPTKAIQDFFAGIPSGALEKTKGAAFDTGMPVQGQKAFMRFIIKFFGYASRRIAALLSSKGAEVISAETFFVLGKEGPLKGGELERAAAWAKKITAGNQ